MKGILKNRTIKIMSIAVAAVMLAGIGTYTVWAVNDRGSSDDLISDSRAGQISGEYRQPASSEVSAESPSQASDTVVVSHTASVPESGTDIGTERAKDIALSQVAGAAETDIVKAERDYDDGRLEYDVEIIYNGYEYDYEIDGHDGRIISSDIDHHDHD